MTTLQERFEAANRPVQVTASVPVSTLLRLEDLAGALGLSTQEAFAEAVGDWVVRREHSRNRQDRLALQKALQEARDRAPVEELLDRFRAQMQASEERRRIGLVERDSVVRHKDAGGALTPGADSAMLPPMKQLMVRKDIGGSIERRRMALGISRERLGAAAGGVARGTVERVERSQVKPHPRTVAALTQALDRAEQEAAAV
jgi:ribosome-binding protein aMBF1 (putative translation factor)